jgi:hypothetical protein
VYQKCPIMLESSLPPIVIMYLQRPDMRVVALASDGEAQLPLHVFADPVWEDGSFSYCEALRSVHGPPEQCGQALMVSCAYGGS